MLLTEPPRRNRSDRRSGQLTLRGLILSLSLVLVPIQAPAQADDQTLADIRQELSVLFVELQRLKRELSTTGSPSVPIGGGAPLERLDAIEVEMQRLTAKTERLEFRLNSVVKDGTNRVGDLEFRLCELEPKCDVGKLGQTGLLGGGTGASAPAGAITPNAPKPSGGTEMALAEQADFDRAKAALDAGEFTNAATGFQDFLDSYPGGQLTSTAQFYRGQSLEGMGETSAAARAYLESFSGDPNGKMAPNALLRLGVTLADLGQNSEACVTLGEVSTRFPGGDPDTQAQETRRELGCS